MNAKGMTKLVAPLTDEQLANYAANFEQGKMGKWSDISACVRTSFVAAPAAGATERELLYFNSMHSGTKATVVTLAEIEHAYKRAARQDFHPIFRRPAFFDGPAQRQFRQELYEVVVAEQARRASATTPPASVAKKVLATVAVALILLVV